MIPMKAGISGHTTTDLSIIMDVKPQLSINNVIGRYKLILITSLWP